MPRFPLTLGSTVVAAPTPPASPALWTNLGPGAISWIAVGAGPIPRFEHIFPQESGAEQQFVKVTDPPFGTPGNDGF